MLIRPLILLLALAWASRALAFIPHGTAIANPFPAMQSVSFGGNTPGGYGGHPLNYTNQAALGAGTRFLCKVAELDHASTPVTNLKMDDRNFLVPNAAYGAALGASPLSASPETVTVKESTTSCGSPTYTGAQSVITVTWIANALTLRENTSAASGCTVNCEVTVPDGTANVHGDWGSQFDALSYAANVKYGDTVYLRDGSFNPAGVTYAGIHVPVGGYTTGTGGYTFHTLGYIRVVSETQDASIDANGNPTLANGFISGGLYVKDDASGAQTARIQFDYIQGYQNATTGFYGSLIAAAPDNYGVSVTNSRFSCGASNVCQANGWTFATLGDDSWFEGNHLVGANADIALNVNRDGATHFVHINSNICEQMTDDCVHWNWGNTADTMDDNFAFNWGYHSGSHADSAQWAMPGGPTSTTIVMGEIKRNISVRNVSTTSGQNDAQGWAFMSDWPTGTCGSALTVANNIDFLTFANQIGFQCINNPVITANTTLSVATPNPASLGDGQLATIGMSPAPAGTGGTFTHNAANAYSLGLQNGSPTITPNVTMGTVSNAAYTAAMTGYVDSGFTTRAGWITAATPKVGGTFWEGDGGGGGASGTNAHYSGALFPDSSWNDGGTYTSGRLPHAQ